MSKYIEITNDYSNNLKSRTNLKNGIDNSSVGSGNGINLELIKTRDNYH